MCVNMSGQYVLKQNHFREFMFYLCYLYLFMHSGVQHTLKHTIWYACRVTITVAIVEKYELVSLPEHPG